MDGDGMPCLAGSCAEIEGFGKRILARGTGWVLRKTSNRGLAEGWIELRFLVFGPVFFMCC